MLTFLFSALINGTIKEFVKRPRPYQAGAKPILQKTDGYSMPSGHAQNVALTSIFILDKYPQRKWLRNTLLAMSIIVPFTRIYLGQHYLSDVLVGLLLGVIFGYLGIYFFKKFADKEEYIALTLIPLFVILMLIHGSEQLIAAGAAYIGLAIGYYLEKTYIKSEVQAPLKIQVLKLIIGLGIIFGLKEGLKSLFSLIGTYFFLDVIRYFILGLWASFGALTLFKYAFKTTSQRAVLQQQNK